jgi:hypothetical protein
MLLTLADVRPLLWEYAAAGADGLKVPLSSATNDEKAYWLGKLNQVQERLMNMGVWSGGWVSVRDIPIHDGTITVPRRFKTCAGVNLCCGPSPIYSRFWKFTESSRAVQCSNGVTPINDQAQTFITPSGTYYLRIKSSTVSDNTKVVTLFGGLNEDGDELFDSVTLTITSGSPATTSREFTSIPRISKVATVGQVDLYSVDTTTAEETLIATYAPYETLPGYKQYEIQNVGDETSVDALCNLAYVPAVADTDIITPGVLGGLKHGLKALTYEDTSDERQDDEWARALKALDEARTTDDGFTIPSFRFDPNFGAGSIINVM